MHDKGLLYIADDLTDTWIEDWANAVIAEVEAYLAKHAAFLRFCEDQED
jgi:hypothetical protein